jgi:flagellar hook-associated protein FlgK
MNPLSFRDRTNEFRSAAKTVAPSPSADSRSAHSDFRSRASNIALGIQLTSQKLARLAKCIYRTTFFFFGLAA